ncbi:Bifunctional inhibitor/lipid-transfer protein/seed storage 2S albumin superfamily protein [Abeliophyllum distichum]|uniref:Bifunctional inhibitor/lipid-transfer protein/seed storage 2S albumin superfamily protein n=1 Tax=Abeliophyllum distichum TaxID=126358 RepID=A0ABD1P3A1_9LAMI
MAAMKSVVSFSLRFRATWLVVLLLVLIAQNDMTQSQAQSSCSSSLANLNVCAPFVVPGATNTAPSSDCCGALQSLDHDCMCNMVRVAARLPAQCNLASLNCGG